MIALHSLQRHVLVGQATILLIVSQKLGLYSMRIIQYRLIPSS